MNKINLLIVIPHLTIGGVQKTLISALKAVDYDKYDVTIYLRKNRTELLSFIDKRAKIIVNNDSNKYYRRLKAIFFQLQIEFLKVFGKKDKAEEITKKLSVLIQDYSVDYEKKTYFSSTEYDVAISYVQGYTAYFVAKAIKAKQKIIFFHTSVDELHSIHEQIIPEFDKAVAIHDEQVALITDWYPSLKGKIFIIENYVDNELILEQSKAFSIPEANKTVICSCGRFSPVKGFDMAVEAAKILKDNGSDFIWYFVGDGPERSRLESMISKYGLENDIIITGMQKNPYPYIAGCDIYVQPSYEEALGLTILEAHRLSKPIITTATVGGCKLVQDGVNGIVCEINPKAIAESVTGLINDKAKYEKLVSLLKATDYSYEFQKYKEQWKNLLEG